jgi:hypothetical protein
MSTRIAAHPINPKITSTGNALGNMATRPAQTFFATSIINGVMIKNDQNVLEIKLSSNVRWALYTIGTTPV